MQRPAWSFNTPELRAVSRKQCLPHMRPAYTIERKVKVVIDRSIAALVLSCVILSKRNVAVLVLFP